MTCKRCGKQHVWTRFGLCRMCTTITDLEKAGYTAREIKALLKLMTKQTV